MQKLQSQADHLFSSIDVDGDGVITPQEFEVRTMLVASSLRFIST